MPGTAELDEIARPRPVPVVLQHAVHEETGSEHQCEQDKRRIAPPLVALAYEADEERPHRAQHERGGDPWRHLVEERPRQLTAKRPVVFTRGVEEARCSEVERSVREQLRNGSADRGKDEQIAHD